MVCGEIDLEFDTLLYCSIGVCKSFLFFSSIFLRKRKSFDLLCSFMCNLQQLQKISKK